ncbi:hypothetical protein, unknown function [Leishmania tarentolae]|uniref:Uncharacterized protein n=1 Tax=Leishmania tarentolae TaxID=5689 RepID=A0A640KNC9_LEITA|nr:hypothetical protein, unknown function [Leishmania tarentolae]
MSVVVDEQATPSVGMSVAQNGSNIRFVEAAGEDDCSAVTMDPVSQAPRSCGIQSTVSVVHTRIFSRPSAGGLRFSDAARTAAAGSSDGSKSHGVPYEGTVVHLPSRGRVWKSVPGAGAVANAPETNTDMPLATEKAKAAKEKSGQETAAAGHTAMPAKGKKRVPEVRLTRTFSQKAQETHATDTAADDSGSGATKKLSRRRCHHEKTAGAPGRQVRNPQTTETVIVKVIRAKKPVRVSRTTEGENGTSGSVAPSTSALKPARRKLTASTTDDAAVGKRSSKQKCTKKSIHTSAAAASAANARSTPNSTAAHSHTEEKSAQAVEALVDETCADRKSTVGQVTIESDEILNAYAVEN